MPLKPWTIPAELVVKKFPFMPQLMLWWNENRVERTAIVSSNKQEKEDTNTFCAPTTRQAYSLFSRERATFTQKKTHAHRTNELTVYLTYRDLRQIQWTAWLQ